MSKENVQDSQSEITMLCDQAQEGRLDMRLTEYLLHGRISNPSEHNRNYTGIAGCRCGYDRDRYPLQRSDCRRAGDTTQQ